MLREESPQHELAAGESSSWMCVIDTTIKVELWLQAAAFEMGKLSIAQSLSLPLPPSGCSPF